MAPPVESSVVNDACRSIESWVWPMTAAIIVGGILLLFAGAGLSWLAAHPARQSTVIWIPHSVEQSTPDNQRTSSRDSIALENRSDAHSN